MWQREAGYVCINDREVLCSIQPGQCRTCLLNQYLQPLVCPLMCTSLQLNKWSLVINIRMACKSLITSLIVFWTFNHYHSVYETELMFFVILQWVYFAFLRYLTFIASFYKIKIFTFSKRIQFSYQHYLHITKKKVGHIIW